MKDIPESRILRDVRGHEKEILAGALVVASLYPAGRVAGAIYRNPRAPVRIWQWGTKTLAASAALGPAYEAIGPEKRVAFRWGGTGGYERADQHWMTRWHPASYGPAGRLRVPQTGWQFTAVPSSEPVVRTPNKSRGVQVRTLTSRMGHQKGRASSSRPSATRKSQSQTRTRGKKNRRKVIPRRGKRCPPGYRYDAKRKMCIQTFKR